MSISHEDVRYNVLNKLKKSILDGIDYIRKNEPQLYSKMSKELEEYQEIINKGQLIPLIVRNERIIKGIGKPDIEVFGGKILIELKVKLSEFADGFNKLSKYVQFYPYAEFAIITNFQNWEFYRIEKGILKPSRTLDLDYIIRTVMMKGVKVSLSTENVKNMFKPIIVLEPELQQIFREHGEKIEALFKAYRNIIRRLYEKASEREIEGLFIRHTLMQMIVSSCLTASLQKITTPLKACSGAEIEAEIVLPYLNWWERVISCVEQKHRAFLESLLNSIYSRAMLLDWKSGKKEDVFRELYEILIDAETRRKIGEYYTPLWLVEFMVDKVSRDINGLKDKTVLDPFCGSGTFLVIVFYKKIEEGEDPDTAIQEVIGFDINPLAVSVARAELIIAYQSIKKGLITPLVFNADSASLLLRSPAEWESTSFLTELKSIEELIRYINYPTHAATKIDFSEILKIEMILREYFREVSISTNIKKELEKRFSELKERGWKGFLTGNIIRTLSNEKSIDAISKLIKKYGNGVWAASITSLFAPHIIRKLKVDVITTNPPWVQLIEPKGSYGEPLREKAKQLLKNYEKTGQIINGSDISSVLLYGCINITKHEVAFLMPKEVVYTADSYHGLGKILTYSIAKDYCGEVIEVNFDAFQHGRIPSIVFLRRNGKQVECYSANIKYTGVYSKALHLSSISFTVKKRENYQDYIEKVALYTEISSEAIKERMGVDEVVPKGDHIMGLFGGERKRGAKKYAGLIFDVTEYDKTAEQFFIRLHGTKSSTRIPKWFLNSYWKKILYRGEIFPFYLNNAYNVLLSSKGAEDLRNS